MRIFRNATPYLYILTMLLISVFFSTSPGRAGEAKQNGVVVYYFHRTVRCPSCTMLEEFARDAVEFGFDGESKKRDLTFEAVNLDDDKNGRFVEHYSLSAQSIVISEIEDGKEKRWKRLDEVWTLLHDEGRVFEYIREEILDYLNRNP